MRFAGKGAEKFSAVSWSADAAGQAFIAGAGVVFTCVAEILQPAGDHTVVIGGIVGIDHDPSQHRPRCLLISAAAADAVAGHSAAECSRPLRLSVTSTSDVSTLCTLRAHAALLTNSSSASRLGSVTSTRNWQSPASRVA
jgi:hypothetical protein